MAGMSGILASFAEALELEKELGTRTVEFDRALLRPAPAAAPPVPAPSPAPAPAPSPVAAAPRSAPAAQQAPAPRPSAPQGAPAAPARPSKFHPLVCVVYDAAEWEGEAGALFDKMIGAIGLTRADVSLEVAASDLADRLSASSPRPKCVVAFGSNAKRALFGRRAIPRSTWTVFGGVPAVVTVSPAHIARFAPGSKDGLYAERREAWHCLLQAKERLAAPDA